jgi:iron complex outermembrane receptor protein
MHTLRPVVLIGLAQIAPAVLVAAPTDVQEELSPVGLEEVIVTAQKRAESLQDAPISIVALSSETLATRGIQGLTNLQSDVPGLIPSRHPNSAATVRLFLRGIGQGNDQITYDPKVAFYIDGVYMARFQGLAAEVAELDRVEVLRGPQGTLYGRNTTGGAINFITRAPQLGEFGFRQDLAAGNRDRFSSRTRFNIPMGEKAAAELSYLRVRENGFVRNAGTGVPRFGDQDRQAWRAAFLWQPNERVDLRYTFDQSGLKDTPVWMAAVPLYPAEADRPTESSATVTDLIANDITGLGHNLTVTFEIDEALTLKSITSYRELGNFTYMPYHPGLLAPPPFLINIVDMDQEQLTQEFQLIGAAFDSRLEYIAGAYYFDESATSHDTNVLPLTGGGMRIDRHPTADNVAYALYGQTTYTPSVLSERLHLTIGGRWSKDERKATKQDTTTLANGMVVPAPRGTADRTFTDFSPSATVAYDITDDLGVYAKVATGYQTGGFNLTASTLARFSAGFGPEYADSYELGLKSTWFDNRLRLNAALFTTERTDMQVSVPDPNNLSVTDVFNAGKATINGLEVDVTARPVPALDLSLAYAWTEARFDRITNSLGQNVKDLYAYDQVPRHKASATAGYEWPATKLGVPTASVTYSYQSRMNASTSLGAVIGSHGLLDARVGLGEIPVAGGRLRFSLWGRNLTDEEYEIFHFIYVVPTAMFGDPRSYGADLTLEF